MPMQAAKRVVKKAAKRVASDAATVREHWTQQEAHRRREMAELMQHHLIQALGLATVSARRAK